VLSRLEYAMRERTAATLLGFILGGGLSIGASGLALIRSA